MTEGSGLYLAGPSLVKAAIGQEISSEDLGGATVHATISGTVDYHEPDDASCLARLRRLVALLPADPSPVRPAVRAPRAARRRPVRDRPHRPLGAIRRARPAGGPGRRRPVRRVPGRVTAGRSSAGSRGWAGWPSASSPTSGCGSGPRGTRPFQFGGVIYADSADKAARFVLDCNQCARPAAVPPGRQRVRRRPRRRAVGDHPPRGEAGQRGEQQRGPEDHAARRPLVRRGALRALRPGVRPALPLRLAGRPLRRDGGRAGVADDARRPGRRPEAPGEGRRRRRTRRRWPTTSDAVTIARPTSDTPPRAGWVDAIIDPAETRDVLIMASPWRRGRTRRRARASRRASFRSDEGERRHGHRDRAAARDRSRRRSPPSAMTSDDFAAMIEHGLRSRRPAGLSLGRKAVREAMAKTSAARPPCQMPSPWPWSPASRRAGSSGREPRGGWTILRPPPARPDRGAGQTVRFLQGPASRRPRRRPGRRGRCHAACRKTSGRALLAVRA